MMKIYLTLSAFKTNDNLDLMISKIRVCASDLQYDGLIPAGKRRSQACFLIGLTSFSVCHSLAPLFCIQKVRKINQNLHL